MDIYIYNMLWIYIYMGVSCVYDMICVNEYIYIQYMQAHI